MGAIGSYVSTCSIDAITTLKTMAPHPCIALWSYYIYVIGKERWRKYFTALKILKLLVIFVLCFNLATIMVTIKVVQKGNMTRKNTVEKVAAIFYDWGYAFPFGPG
jgi:energy-coupling factor transporter transmembrane protein EcfT